MSDIDSQKESLKQKCYTTVRFLQGSSYLSLQLSRSKRILLMIRKTDEFRTGARLGEGSHTDDQTNCLIKTLRRRHRMSRFHAPNGQTIV
jgi:hypothetical protein